MSIGIVTSCYGLAYYGFLDEWSAAILELERQPDWVTIAHDGVPAKYRQIVDRRLDPVWVTDDRPVQLHPQIHVNAAIAVTFTDWIIKADVDDVLLPHALNGWETMGADVVNFGYRIGDQDYPSRAISAETMLEKIDNPMGSCSPFRRWVWETNQFEDLLFDDWAFWIKAARAGAIFTSTQRVDYVYRTHPGQISKRLDSRLALEQIRAL